MTAKEFIKSKMPNAKSEKQKTNGGRTYFLIRDGKSVMPYASGSTERSAWSNAKKLFLEYNK